VRNLYYATVDVSVDKEFAYMDYSSESDQDLFFKDLATYIVMSQKNGPKEVSNEDSRE